MENEIEPIYNSHYIKVDDQNRIIDGWSDGVFPDRDATSAICINAQGGYQFRIFLSGEENPILYTADGVPLYEWDGEEVQKRTEFAISADRTVIPESPPSEQEQLRADVDFLAALQGVIL